MTQRVLGGLRSARQFSSSASIALHGVHQLPTEPAGYVELRQYTLHPDGMKAYLNLTGDHVESRKQRTPFLGMFTCDTGSLLNRITHFYQYNDLDERDATRAAMAGDVAWQRDYIDAGRPWVAAQHFSPARAHVYQFEQESRLLKHAPAVHAAAGAGSAAAFESPPRPAPGSPRPVYEMRTYQLHPGYGNVPAVTKAFESGLPAKMAADPIGRLVFFGSTDIGVLNNVVELWRYPSAQASIRARVAARTVAAWQETIRQVTPLVQTFETCLLHPTPFSPWQ